jgi:hypothetical protein
MDELDWKLRVLKLQIRATEKEIARIKRRGQCIQLPDLLHGFIDDAGRSLSRELRRMGYARAYRSNPDKKIRRNTQLQRRRSADPLFRLRARLIFRNRIYLVFKRNGLLKSQSTFSILGCDFHTVKKWIERKFQPGMSWDNLGEWHIDHKDPLATGRTEEEILRLCHYTNLQPLWAIDNLRKGAKL